MKRILLLSTITFVGCSLFLQPIDANQKRHRGTSITTDGKVITDCGEVRIRFRDGVTSRSEQLQRVPASSIASLQVRTGLNGGINVHGWDRDEYSIRACLAATGETEQEARDTLKLLTLSVQNGQVGVEGPGEWVAYLIIQAPNGATLDLSSTNGPIGLSGISGNIQARAINGPLSFHEVGGEVRAEVHNGPIDVTGGGGNFRLNAQNGPVTVELTGSYWSGGELEAHTRNGPLTLKVPEYYQSAVRVDASKHSPVQCDAPQCREAARTWDQPNVIRFGSSDPVIRLSTINGPVTITHPGRK